MVLDVSGFVDIVWTVINVTMSMEVALMAATKEHMETNVTKVC